MSPGVLAQLCEPKPLQALESLIPLARAGDEHAITAVALLGNIGSTCDAMKPSADFPRSRTLLLERARLNGATSETLQRLGAHLAEEQEGPTAEELEACRQSAAAFQELMPGMLEQFVGVLGRSVQTLRGENELDVSIEHRRKVLTPGDADGQLQLALLLLEKDTPESAAEAMALLRSAANTSPAAMSELARCLLKGCPTPADDPTEARELLTKAALAGDHVALRILAGPRTPEEPSFDPYLPAADRFAWQRFLGRLDEEGCFGPAAYLAWAISPAPAPNLLAMSAADAEVAETRAARLLGEPLQRTRRALGCQ